jgi:hypothetical protein
LSLRVLVEPEHKATRQVLLTEAAVEVVEAALCLP